MLVHARVTRIDLHYDQIVRAGVERRTISSHGRGALETGWEYKSPIGSHACVNAIVQDTLH